MIRAVGSVLASSPSARNNTNFRLLSTDAWDITDLAFESVANFLIGKSYVVIPGTSGQERMHLGRNLTKHMEELSPRTSR